MTLRRRFSFGEDTIFCDGLYDGDAWVVVGNAKINGKYRILIMRLAESGKIIWKKNYGEKDEYEARTISKTSGGYLIGGNAHGRATIHGGEGWKGYALLIDENGNKLNERCYELGDNDAIYDVIGEKDKIYCLGESEKEGRKSVFVIRLNMNLDVEKKWLYGEHRAIFAGGITRRFLSYSYAEENKWSGRIIRKDENMDSIWVREIEEFVIYSMLEYNQNLLIGGSKNNNALLVKMDMNGNLQKEIVLGDGAVIHILEMNKKIIALGEINEHPAFYILDEEFKIIKEDIDSQTIGWYERGIIGKDDKILALKYSALSKDAVISEI